MSKKELEKYKDYLNRLLKSDSDDVFMNSGVEHANILLSTLFDNTRNDARIFSNGLELNGVCGRKEYEESLTKLVYSEELKYIKILLRTQPDENNKIYKLLKSSEKVEIKTITPELEKTLFSDLKYNDCNFSVYDNKMVRLEYIPEEYKAAGSFNFPKLAIKLSSLFDRTFNDIS